MKWVDLILIGGALVGGYFISNALQGKSGTATTPSTFLTGAGAADVIGAGGTIKTTKYKEPNTVGMAASTLFGLPGLAYSLLEGSLIPSTTQMITGDPNKQKNNTGMKSSGGGTISSHPKGIAGIMSYSPVKVTKDKTRVTVSGSDIQQRAITNLQDQIIKFKKLAGVN